MTVKNFELSHNFELTVFELTGSDLYIDICCRCTAFFKKSLKLTNEDLSKKYASFLTKAFCSRTL